MKVYIHVPPRYGYFLKEVLKEALKNASDIIWGSIIYSNRDELLNEFTEIVGHDNILYLQRELNNFNESEVINLEVLKDFPASIMECVFSSKQIKGHKSVLDLPRKKQLAIIIKTYRIYKMFLLDKKPNYIFFPILERYDSVILYHLCKELNINPIIYSHSRSIGLSYFSDSLYETLPYYVMNQYIPNHIKADAQIFIDNYQNSPMNHADNTYQPLLEETLDLSYIPTNRFQWIINFIKSQYRKKTTCIEPYVTDTYTLRHKLKILFLSVLLKYRKNMGERAKREYDILKPEDLPLKFIYYPLQYTPEVSINIPAPFFIDQFRSIDLILTSMPADYYLIIKEHPAMEGMRSKSFYKSLKQRSNVLLVDYAISSIEMIKKAGLTISVTGTSCLEAFLLGKPSLHIGRAFFSDWIYKFDSFTDLKKIIKEAIAEPEVNMEKRIDLVARIKAVGDDFVFFCPDDHYRKPEELMNTRNVKKFLSCLLRHIKNVAKESD